ncbi:UvrB/UvrC motif-containing protein [bacterium]|nr:UvrB/UvrC motif-containing protein [bacterium]
MMKKCDVCGKAAADVRCVIVVKDKKVVRHLCADCARKAGFDEQLKYNHKTSSDVLNIVAEPKDIICPGCKLGFSQFLETGLFGCPRCYETFDRLIGEILRGIHSATYHKGRKPGKERTLDLAQLKWKLSGAVQMEDFEKAAKLRDAIKAIEKDSN